MSPTHTISTPRGDVWHDGASVSMVMIAKNEERNIDRCFASFWDDCDEVVLVDTGSTDQTVELAEAFAQGRGEPEKLKIGHYTWNDSFADARNYADSLATCQWRAWIDLDDEVHGLANLRKIAAEAEPDLVMIYALYDYALDQNGNCFCELWRERLVRAGAGTTWIGRVHECQIGNGKMMRIDRDKALWVHRRDVAEMRDRNEKLLRGWVEEDPHDARAVSYLAFELMGSRLEHEREGEKVTEPDRDKLIESIQFFQRYLEMPNQPPEARAQTTRRFAQVLLTLDRFQDAQNISAPMLVECPWWPDTLLTLAEIAHEQQDWKRTIDFANQALQRGKPDTMLIINPEDYSLRPRVLIASALAATGQLEEAIKVGQEVIAVNPGYMGMEAQVGQWATSLVREQAGQTWANNAQLLVMNDEPEKAIVLLNTAPYFSNDHPAIVAARVRAANALMEPYQVEKLVDSPRARFLKRALEEQMVARPEGIAA